MNRSTLFPAFGWAIAWIAISALVVGSIDRYSPLLSWQSVVVFGGACVVFVVVRCKGGAA